MRSTVARRASSVAQIGLVQGRLFRADGGLPSYAEWSAYLLDAQARLEAQGRELEVSTSRACYLRAVLAPDWTDRQELGLPRALSFLYYIYRPVRLIAKHRTRIFQRI